MTRQQKYLVIAILIPILMIIFVALSLLIPVKKIIPPYNFVYAVNDQSESFTCLQNTMAKLYPKTMNINFYKIDPNSCKTVKLFIYDFKNESATAISFEQAARLHLKENLNNEKQNMYISKSCYDGPSLGLWSMSSNNNDICLTDDNYKQLVNIHPKHEKNNFLFIGWILPETAKHQE